MIARPRRRWTSLLACLPLAAIAALATPGAGHAATAGFGSTTVSYIVHTDEADIYLEVVHPTLNGQIVTAPVILTYTPYAALGRNGGAAHWTGLGYARATADVIGTGNSGGCWDYGGMGEKQTAYDVIEAIAAQPWSNGQIGMLGGSYEGTTQYAAAVMHPPHLTTIVPEAAIDRWYDYAYAGGIRYTYTNQPLGYEGAGTAGDEGIDTPLAFDFGLALTKEQAQEIPQVKEMIDNPPDWLQEWSRQIGAELEDGLREGPSWIAFARENGTVYHTYTVMAPDPFVAPYFSFLLERTPKTQPDEPRTWRKDEYPD